MFAVPHRLLADYYESVSMETYRALTGRPWNRWSVRLLDRENASTARVRGMWGVVWQSRDGIASARVDRKSEGKWLSVELQTSSDFDPDRDYLLVEYHEEVEQAWTQDRVKETWRIETLAGVTPQWVIFPKAWQAWAWDKEVAASAHAYISTNVPSGIRKRVVADIAAVEQQGQKEIKARMWRSIAGTISEAVEADFGMLPAHSWTAVNALPMRIARKLAECHGFAEWAPPKKQPEYADPAQSGRRVLANEFGPYPTQGPGVEYEPHRAPVRRREGELG